MSTGQKIKCVVWDLDGTLWEGVLFEGGGAKLLDGVAHVIRTLDQRGILQSIASKNNHEPAMQRLQFFGLAAYFLCPQIGWGSKAQAIGEISRRLNIAVDHMAFIDDQAFELDAVRFAFPTAFCVDASSIDSLLSLPEMTPRFITEESKNRRQMYLADMLRHEAEAQCIEAPDEFLASLNMEVTISLAQKDDLKRAEELTERTHQFNTTGHAYTYEELEMFRVSSDHQLLLVALSDRYASYGIVGLALVECRPDAWTLKSFFVSCRVLSRGIASVLLCHLRNEAARKKVRLLAELVPNDANLVTSIVYKFAGFRVIDQQHGLMVFEDTQPGLQPFPHHMQVGINV